MAAARLARQEQDVEWVEILILRWRFEVGSNDLPGFLAGDDGNDLKGRAGTTPLQDPFLEQPHVVAAHELEATAEVGLDPAIDVLQTIRQRTPAVPQALIDRNHIIVAKSLDDHEQHDDPLFEGRSWAKRRALPRHWPL